MTIAEVSLWGRRIGAVTWNDGDRLASFEYDAGFRSSGIEVSPITMPLDARIHQFPGLPEEAFHGLPGMLADSLPDRYGNALIDAWLAGRGRSPESFNPVERLCYVGSRGTGALEYRPSQGPGSSIDDVDVAALVELADAVLAKRSALSTDIEREVGTTLGYGLIEYAYHEMAVRAGIQMTECRILEEGGRHHFMTRRFDRTDSGKKLHMQSLAALAHFDYNAAGAYSYEQAIEVMRKLALSQAEIEQQYRRTVFNIVARNQDDHVKNIAFLMDKTGRWSLSPAFDVIYSYNPSGNWTWEHQMSVNGKRDGFAAADLLELARFCNLKTARAKRIIGDVMAAVGQWPALAHQAGVDAPRAREVERHFRTSVA